ncbi:MAG: right-handed parallel beta-helix repeat-containing protein, partial [Thermoplasmata archaeon]|nr:right-handed parallel beta-helix repeat-containing protein [Thermoplasmata archaeon]
EGVEVRFNGPYWLYVEGNLTIKGTVPEPVVFTSNKSSPSPADWLNIHINSTGHVFAENATFTYGNSPFIFYYSDDNRIVNCTFHDNFNPIGLYRSNNNTFSRMVVMDNPLDTAIAIGDSSGNSITNSTFRNNQYGISLETGTTGTVVSYNRVLDHANIGIVADAGSSANLIFHNDLMNNTQNGRDNSGGANSWDNGYPAGGNYWDDYSGLDDFSGPNQDLPGSDGIGDSWYSVAPSGIDHYPFMEPLIPVMERTPPEIAGVSILPPLQESGLHVNISADIVDDDFVVGVYLEIRLPDTTTTNDSMMLMPPSTHYLNTTYGQPGLYYFNISAVDSEGLWNKSSGTFSIVDTTNPLIVNASVNPDVQEPYLSVNISATIQDNDLVDFVSFNISCPDNSWTNLTPSHIIQDLYWEELAFDVLGQHNGVVYAFDRSGNSNSSSFMFTISDSTSPSILSFQASHSSQDVNGFVNITSMVQDNYVLGSVFLNISFPSGTYSNTSMFESAPSEYYLNESFHEVGDHLAALWATDTSGNTAAQSLSFSIVDGSFPVITSVSVIPPLQDYGGNVNISAQVNDNHALEYVKLNLTIPGAGPTSYPMNEGESGLYYVNQTYEFIGFAQFEIESADMSGNVQTSPGSFEMRDMSRPEILSAYASPDIQEAGDSLSFVADVEDNHGVWGVWVDVCHPDSSTSNHTMSWNETSQLYEVRLSFRHHGAYEFDVWANDTSDNWNHSGSSFWIVDTTSPMIEMVSITPDPQEVREAVDVAVVVSDGGIISQVYVEAKAPESGTVGNTSCTSLDGENYTATLIPTELGIYELTIVALDSADNLKTFDAGFSTVDTTSPVAHAGGDKTVERGQPILLNASSSQDNHRISEYNWSFVEDDQMKYLEGAVVPHTFVSTGNITVTLTVRDPSGKAANDIALISVEDTTPPSPPQNIRVSKGDDSSSLVLMWDANAEDDLDHYLVLRSRNGSGDLAPIAVAEKDTMSYTDSDVEQGSRYWYALIAIDESSNPSNVSEIVSGVVGEVQNVMMVIILVALIIATIAVVVVYLWKRRNEPRKRSEREAVPDEEHEPE